MIQGVDLYGRHIELHEPGNGITKVVIQDAPIEMPNDIIKYWVEQYGWVGGWCGGWCGMGWGGGWGGVGVGWGIRI